MKELANFPWRAIECVQSLNEVTYKTKTFINSEANYAKNLTKSHSVANAT